MRSGSSDAVQPGSKDAQAGKEQAAEPLRSELFPLGVFPPENTGPPFERSAHEGDGVWRAVFEPSPDGKVEDRADSGATPGFGRAIAARMVIHPHEASRFQKLVLAAFDLRHLTVHHMAGQADVLDVKHPELETQAGLVPADVQSRLLAVFNGGFQPRHGRWGMLSLGKQLIPPREDGCTVAVQRDGTVVILPWTEMQRMLDQVVAYRQTPPCLVIDGEVHPQLEKGSRSRWAGQNADRKTRRRSAVGVTADGRTLIYGLGTETEADVLAAGMSHAGARYAAQLDINWNWTRLFFFDADETPPKVLGSLEKDMAKDRGEYVIRHGKRGFFYLLHRESQAEKTAD